MLAMMVWILCAPDEPGYPTIVRVTIETIGGSLVPLPLHVRTHRMNDQDPRLGQGDIDTKSATSHRAEEESFRQSDGATTGCLTPSLGV